MIVCVILISACNKGVIYITEGVVTWFGGKGTGGETGDTRSCKGTVTSVG